MRALYGYVCRYLAHGLGARGVVCGLLAALIGPAFGQALPASWALVPKAVETTNGYQLTYAANSSGTALATSGRTVAQAAANDALIASEAAALRTAAGNAAISLSRSVGGAVVRQSLARAALAASGTGLVGPAIAAAAVLGPMLADWMQAQGYQQQGGSGQWLIDQGVPPVAFLVDQYCSSTAVCTPASLGSSALLAAVYGSSSYGGVGGCTSSDSYFNLCADIKVLSGNQYVTVMRVLYRWVSTGTYCGGGTVVPATGVCPGALAEPDPAVVAAKAEAAPMPATITDWEDALANAAVLGQPVDLPDTATVTGPATVTSPETVTSTQVITDANGQTQALTETSKLVSHLTYSGDQVTVQTDTVTNTQNPDGSTTQTTKTNPAESSICDLLPNVLGCTQLGTAEAASVPTASKTIAYTSESVSLPSACPAPISVGRFGSLSFQPACDSAGYMRPLILAGSAIMALMICVAAVAGVKP